MIVAAELEPQQFDWWKDWRGECVAIVASGPSTSKATVDALRNRIHVIAIKKNIELCPWADVVYGCDAAWWQSVHGLPNYKGLKLSWADGGARHYPDVRKINIALNSEQILVERPTYIGSGRNSGFQAINIAVQFGATGILLVGFDANNRSGVHWYGRNGWMQANNPGHDNFQRWQAGFNAAAPMLRAFWSRCREHVGHQRDPVLSAQFCSAGARGLGSVTPPLVRPLVRRGPSIWIGFDRREAPAFAVARHSLFNRIPRSWPVYGIVLRDLQKNGLYTRPTKVRTNGDGRFEMIDQLSIRDDYDGRMSTEHAIARFLVPHLAQSGWALFMDGDMLVRGAIGTIFNGLDPRYAVYCVKHNHDPKQTTKMDNQIQTRYARKNWSSFCIWNVEHPSNKLLTLEMINTVPGRDLHAFCWLTDDEIGTLDPHWNWLVGESDPAVEPKVVHFTNGTPEMVGYEHVQFADDWRDALDDWARGSLNLPG